jgi:subtilisin family serine protease
MHGHNNFRNQGTGPAKDETRQGGDEFDDCGSDQPFVPPPMRELIEVEFNKDARSGVEDWDFGKKTPATSFPCDWQPGLIKILEDNKLVSWKPSFPLKYPWSRKCSAKAAKESFKKAGRDKFVTFKFPQGTDVVQVAKELTDLLEIDHAVAVPHIAPPCEPLEEPFTGSSDQVESMSGQYGSLSNQWYLFRCGVPEAWAQSASGEGVVIAAIDWGFDLNHPDLSHTELSENVMRDIPNVADGNLLWHGNGVLGLAGAAVNGNGMAGIAYGAALWAIQAASGGLNRPVVDHRFWVDAINFVRTTPAGGRRKVIILELQTAGFSNPEMILSLRTEIMAAIAEGIIVCVPAGNGNRDEDAGLDDVGSPLLPPTGAIVVGATSFDPEINPRAPGTNGGNRVTVYAPGDKNYDLTCGLRDGYRDNFGGTSGATAKVAGVVALMLQMNEQLTPQQVSEILGRSRKVVLDEAENSDSVGILVDANQAVTDAIALRTTLPTALQAA